MAEEKIFTFNLSKISRERTRWRRKESAVKILKNLLQKSSRSEELKMDKGLNEVIWKGGKRSIRIKLTKIDEKTSKAELVV